MSEQGTTQRQDKIDAACDWSDFRSDYGVSSNESILTLEHRAFVAGWVAGRHGPQDASPLR